MGHRERFETDVLVTGGSLEGCIAALELAKRGKRVMLTEKSGSLGGASTNGLEVSMHWEKMAGHDAREYGRCLWEQAGRQEGLKGPLYHDQKGKVALARMLKQAGVIVLTHIFPYEVHQEKEGILCRAECKTGTMEIHAKAVIDAQPFLESAGMAGLSMRKGTDTAEGAVKWNGISAEALKRCLKPGYEEGEGYLMGELCQDYTMERKGIRYAGDQIRCCHSGAFGETIFGGITVRMPEPSPFVLSDALAGLRIYVYGFRDYLRAEVPGCEGASIIHVAPVLNLYGIRRFERSESDRVFPIGMERYSNEEAIVGGMRVAKACGELLDGSDEESMGSGGGGPL